MDTNSRSRSNKNTKKCLKSHLEDVRLEDNKIEQAFPWLPKFNKDIRSCTGSRNYEHLERLLLLYTQNILSSIGESTVKFSEINLMKNHINKMLIFFHMYWLDIKQQDIDHSQYLNKISALLNVYIDMELKTFSHYKSLKVVTNSSKVAAKILAALYIYLNNSEEHIFRILLRNKYTEKYTKVCNLIFTKSFTNLKTKTSITDVAYIRYLLAFKMWRKMEETTKINKLALMLLGPRMPKLQDELLKFVPIPPVGQENETLWLIQSNLFDENQVHKQFLLFEDKMDGNSTGLQSTKTIHADQNCSKPQIQQMNSLFRPNNSNRDTFKQKINKRLDSLQNNNTLSNNKNNKNKFLEIFHLQKNGSRNFKSSKKINNSKKTIIIDLTEDETNIPYSKKSTVKRKRTQRSGIFEYLEHLKVIDKKSRKHINLKYSDKLVNADIKKCSNDDKNLGEKIRLEYKPVDIKISDNSENCTSVNSRSLNDICQTSNCLELAKEDEKQHDYNLHYLKSSMFDDQNINELKITANAPKKSKLENGVSLYVTIGNTTNSYDNSITQNKGILTSQEESAMETIPLFKTCQNNVADQNYQFDFKQELPTSTDCSMQKSCTCCNTMHVIDHFIMSNLKSITDRSSQIREMIKQKTCRQVNECPYTEIDCKSSFSNGNTTTAKAQKNLHNTFNDNENDIKLACDTNIIYTLRNDCNNYVYLLNHTDKSVMTVHAEKQVQCSDKSDDKCNVSTTFTEDQIVEPSTYNQHVNFLGINNYDSVAKYSKATKKQQKESYCDSSILNDRLHSSIFDVDSFDIGPNAEEVDNNLKSFSKKEEMNEITNNYIGNLEHNFSNNIQSETLLEDFFWQSSKQPEINLIGSTGVVNNSKDTCIVSTTSTENQIVESSLDSQHVNSDNRRKCIYEDTHKYSEDTMKEQGRSDCDTSMSSELYTFDTDFFEIDSKEVNEIMKTNCINDFEKSFISFSHFQTLEDILSNGTNFLP